MNGIQAVFEARVSFDPELRYLPDGRAVLNVSAGVADGRGGMDWVRISLWEQLAEEMQDRLKKGVGIYVEGRLTLNTWQGQDGGQRSGLGVNAWRCEIIGLASRRPRPDVDEQRVDRDRRQRIAAAAAEGAERAAARSRQGRR